MNQNHRLKVFIHKGELAVSLSSIDITTHFNAFGLGTGMALSICYARLLTENAIDLLLNLTVKMIWRSH